MDSLLNSGRPPVFCPGCAHERVLHALDRTLMDMGYTGDAVVLTKQNKVLSTEMLMTALKLRFKKVVFEMAMAVTEKIVA